MPPEDSGRRRSALGVAAYLLVPGERRRRAAGHFSRAALEAVRGVRELYVPPKPDPERPGDEPPLAGKGGSQGRQKIDID